MKNLKLKLLKMLCNFCINRQEAYERYADKLFDEISKIELLEKIKEEPFTRFGGFIDITDEVSADLNIDKLIPKYSSSKGNKIKWIKPTLKVYDKPFSEEDPY